MTTEVRGSNAAQQAKLPQTQGAEPAAQKAGPNAMQRAVTRELAIESAEAKQNALGAMKSMLAAAPVQALAVGAGGDLQGSAMAAAITHHFSALTEFLNVKPQGEMAPQFPLGAQVPASAAGAATGNTGSAAPAESGPLAFSATPGTFGDLTVNLPKGSLPLSKVQDGFAKSKLHHLENALNNAASLLATGAVSKLINNPALQKPIAAAAEGLIRNGIFAKQPTFTRPGARRDAAAGTGATNTSGTTGGSSAAAGKAAADKANAELDPAALESAVNGLFDSLSMLRLEGTDIMACIQLLMMELMRDADLDLRDQMETQKARLEQKKQLRARIADERENAAHCKGLAHKEYDTLVRENVIDPSKVSREQYLAQRPLDYKEPAQPSQAGILTLSEPSWVERPDLIPADWLATPAGGGAAVGGGDNSGGGSGANTGGGTPPIRIDGSGKGNNGRPDPIVPGKKPGGPFVLDPEVIKVGGHKLDLKHLDIAAGAKNPIPHPADPVINPVYNPVSNPVLTVGQQIEQQVNNVANAVQNVAKGVTESMGLFMVGGGTPGSVTQTNFEGVENHIKKLTDSLDAIGDQSEMDQLRLQMLMDRRQKALETASNIAKKRADTSSGIIGNMK